MTYIDGFVIPVQKSKLAQYRKMARLGAKLWMECGALDYKECVADDLNVKMPDESGRLKSTPSLFPKMVKAKRGETIVFSYIVYRNKTHRNAVNKKVFSNPKMAEFDPADMPFDMARMATAGFKTIVEASAGRHRTAGARRSKRRPSGRARQPKRAEAAWPTT